MLDAVAQGDAAIRGATGSECNNLGTSWVLSQHCGLLTVPLALVLPSIYINAHTLECKCKCVGSFPVNPHRSPVAGDREPGTGNWELGSGIWNWALTSAD